MRTLKLAGLLIIIVSGLGVSAFAQHSVTLAFTKATTGGSVTGFNIKRGPVGGPYATIGTATASPFTDSSAAVHVEGAKFGYVVSATGPGGESPNSAEAAATIPFSSPDAPTGLTATPR